MCDFRKSVDPNSRRIKQAQHVAVTNKMPSLQQSWRLTGGFWLVVSIRLSTRYASSTPLFSANRYLKMPLCEEKEGADIFSFMRRWRAEARKTKKTFASCEQKVSLPTQTKWIGRLSALAACSPFVKPLDKEQK